MRRGRARAVQLLSWTCLMIGALGCDDSDTRAPGPDSGLAEPDAAASGEPLDWSPPHVDYPARKAGADVMFRLSETGLYRDITTKELAPDLIAYEPVYKLWSDGLDKERWLRLPRGAKIDTSDMDHWQFPVGTMLFKQFSRDSRRLETRLVARLGPGRDDYFMGAFVWNDDESDAQFVPDGAPDVRDSDHDVPTVKQCGTCHNGDRGRVLGYSAVLQPMAAAELSDPPDEPYRVPGDDLAREALGYLHVNCGNCHNEDGAARTDTDLIMRLSVTQHSVETTSVYTTAVNQKLKHWKNHGYDFQIVPGEPDRSAAFVRMHTRDKDDAMPPFASKQVDPDGVALMRDWITSLESPHAD